MSNIIVIGCGQGGLVAAKHLSDYGHKVTVYEACAKDKTAHPWRDDIRRAIFEESGLTPLPKEDCVQKNKWKFISPNYNASLRVPMTPPLEEIAIDRNYLLNRLLWECGDKVDVHFSSPVEKLVVKDNRVCGVVVKGVEISADMVIDASGYNSKFRKQVPAEFGIKEPEIDDKFAAFRGYYKVDDSAEMPDPPCTLYLKHLGGAGISWCNLSQDHNADILVGRIGTLDDEEIKRSKEDLLSRHPFNSGDVIVERKVNIALRYPAPIMVADGYAIVGDSAYMTMPMMGCGIESSMKAGKFLADTIGKECDFSAKSLYPYEQLFYKRLGRTYVFVDVLKRWALNLPTEDVDWAFNSGLVTDDDMALLSTDENAPKLKISSVFKKIGIAFHRLGLIGRALKCVFKALGAMIYARKMPKKYNLKKLKKWADKLDKKVRK